MRLQDDRLDLFGFSEPDEVSYVNLGELIESNPNPLVHYAVLIGIGKTIKIQDRVVYGVLTALGDIGGLYGIILGSCSLLIGFIVDSLYKA